MSTDLPLDEREAAFLGQIDQFVDKALGQFHVTLSADIVPVADRPPVPLHPIQLHDYRELSYGERHELLEAYHGEYGVAYFYAKNLEEPPNDRHPIFDIANQLRNDLKLEHPLDHPMEGHPEAIARFGEPDGTLKLYNLSKDPLKGYVEQAETTGLFAAHNDGLGYGGAVQTVIMYLDSPPLWGGYTYFQNLTRLSIDLLHMDENAFRSLFLPDAITAIRKRGKGAIRVTSPVLFLNEEGQPSVFFRVSTGEYAISWRHDVPALERAMKFLNKHAEPFALGSSFVHFTGRGHGCIVRNKDVVHGRTEYLDDDQSGLLRVLSRKWFMSSAEHAVYKHVPGIIVMRDYACIFPEIFRPELLQGEWLYDASTDSNRRIS